MLYEILGKTSQMPCQDSGLWQCMEGAPKQSKDEQKLEKKINPVNRVIFLFS